MLADALDAAHGAGIVHGALHPSNVIVNDAVTEIVGGSGHAAPDTAVPSSLYAAPEVLGGRDPEAASDQYALAAIAYKWLFGRPIEHAAHRPVDVRTMPGVNGRALSKAFTRALAPEPRDRFASCGDFVDAILASVEPELPLMAAAAEPAAESEDQPAAFNSIEPMAPPPAVASWNPSAPAATPSHQAQGFGGTALIVATLVGAIFGFAAGYMARPRALKQGPAATFAAPAPAAVVKADNPPKEIVEEPVKPTGSSKAAPELGSILVRSTPPGATVSVDGIDKGETPIAVRELALGTRTVTVARRGYIAETRRIAVTEARPSRTLDLRLSPAATVADGRTATPPRAGDGGATTGSLVIDSRPTGANVTVNGRSRGTTPLTITDLTPGEYRIMMTLPGFRTFTTTTRVVAGERGRAAASLTAQEQE